MRILLIVIVFILEVKFLLIIWLISCVKICTSGEGDDFFCDRTSVFIVSDTHTFNDPLSGTTRVSQYQKGKTNLDFTEERDSEWQ